MQHELALPAPEPASAEHSLAVAAWIRERILDSGGSIGFAEFMHHALYAPGLGYYAAGATKFGESGDYVTAPEVSPLFGRIVARQCADALAATGGSLLEYGAGSGRLAADLMQALRERDAMPGRYRIVEPSAELAARQRQLLLRELGDDAARIEWLPGPPAAHRGVVIANEVLDALPVERFVRRRAGVRQVRVGLDGPDFVPVEEPAPDILAAAVAGIEEAIGRRLEDGYASEVCLAAPGWVGDVAKGLAHGVALLFDYGVSRREYYAPQRSGGWLRCHFRHRVHDDPLILPGIQDITAWVDFTAVAGAAVDAGLDVAGYVTQSAFLRAGGLEAELAGLAELPPASRLRLSAGVKMLTLPGQMGEHFKCLCLRRGDLAAPAAFGSDDRTHTL